MVPSIARMNAPRLTLPRVLAAVLLLFVIAYGGAMIWLAANEGRLIFEAQGTLGDRRPAAPLQIDGETWLMRTATSPDSRPWVVFLHGNASTIASRMNILHYERLRDLGLNVIVREYRGYGGVAGVPTESGMFEDAMAAYAYLRQHEHVDPGRIVIYGWSLGSAVAVTLAASVDESAVILEGAPASVVDIGQALSILSSPPDHPESVRVDPPDRADRIPGAVPAQPGRHRHSNRGRPAAVRRRAAAEAIRRSVGRPRLRQ